MVADPQQADADEDGGDQRQLAGARPVLGERGHHDVADHRAHHVRVRDHQQAEQAAADGADGEEPRLGPDRRAEDPQAPAQHVPAGPGGQEFRPARKCPPACPALPVHPAEPACRCSHPLTLCPRPHRPAHGPRPYDHGDDLTTPAGNAPRSPTCCSRWARTRRRCARAGPPGTSPPTWWSGSGGRTRRPASLIPPLAGHGEHVRKQKAAEPYDRGGRRGAQPAVVEPGEQPADRRAGQRAGVLHPPRGRPPRRARLDAAGAGRRRAAGAVERRAG